MTEPAAHDESAALNGALVDTLKRAGAIRSAAVEAAFRAVPRHLFLPGVPPERVYRDEAIATKWRGDEAISSASQPTIVAGMLEQLGLAPGQRVLEIGAGTGYNAALMARMVGETGRVVTIDYDEDIVAGARARLAAAGFGRVAVARGDGAEGYPAGAPYDRIVLTVGAGDIAPAWVAQLAGGGRLLLPLVLKVGQKTVAFERAAGGGLASVSARGGVVFMPLRGALTGSETGVWFGPERRWNLVTGDPGGVDPAALEATLGGPARDRPAAIAMTPRELLASGLATWLELRTDRFCNLFALGAAADDAPFPDLGGVAGKFRATLGLRDGDSLALLMRPPDRAPPTDAADGDPPAVPLLIRGFGPDATLTGQLLEQLAAWDAAGRPGEERLRIAAYPRGAAPVAPEGATVIRKRLTTLVCGWR